MDEEIGNYPHAKLFYRPEEIAFRWCHLMALEQQILREVRHLQGFPNRKFKQWPCLDQKLEILWDAIRNNELLYGSLGITVKSGETVDLRYLTIRHTDLKQWFNQYHPLDKPEFLFTDIERQTTSALTIDIYQALLIELEALKAQRDRNQLLLEELKTGREKLQQENIALLSRLRTTSPPSERSEKAYLRLIGALIDIMLGHSPGGNAYSSFTSQASIISILLAHNAGKQGFTQRTLEDKFAAAKRSVAGSE